MNRLRRVPAPTALPFAAGAVALAIGCYQLSLPNVLTGVLGWNEGYDDGVYNGVAIRLVHGVLPYRDFVFVHPPGIAYLLSPFALIGLAAGSQTTMELARVLTVIVTACNPVLAGLLVRRAGTAAIVISSFSLAVWPLTVSVDRAVELEPFLVFFCLLAAIVMFRDDRPSPRRLVVAGVLLGCAFVVKVWGVLPIVAATLVWLPRWRRELAWLAAGVAAAIVVLCLPLALPAPGAFFHDVIVDQLSRQNTFAATPFADRLLTIFGLPGITAFQVPAWIGVGGFAVLLLGVFTLFGWKWRNRTRLEWFLLMLAAVTFVGTFDAPVLFDHYAYFPAALGAPLLGVVAGRGLSSGISLLGRRRLSPSSGGTLRRLTHGPVAAVALVGMVLAAVLVQQDTTYAARYLSEASNVSGIDGVIPAGACVISDYPPDLIAANRFSPSKPGCPAVVDPYGMFLADDGGTQLHLSPPSFQFPFVEQWFEALQRADYVDLRIPYSDFIPWVPYMITWFSQNYSLVAHLATTYPASGYIDTFKAEYIYERIPSPSG